MEQHHTTEQDFQAKQLPWTNSGVERQKQKTTMDAFLLSIIFRDDFKNRWLQKKKRATTKNITPQAQQLSHLYEIEEYINNNTT